MIDNVFNNVTSTMYILMFIIIIGVLAFVIIKVVLKNSTGTTKGRGELPRHNYAKFDRADSRDYLKFDDIINAGDPSHGFGLLVDENFTRFTCYLTLQGYDYAMATAEERYSTAMNMKNVIKAIDTTLQIRQDARPADFTLATQKCNKIISDCNEKLSVLDARLNTLILRLETLSQIKEPTAEDVEAGVQVDEQIEDTKREMAKMSWIIDEQEMIKAQYASHTDITAEKNPERYTLYIMDWYYLENEHINRSLTRDEIYKEAINKLWTKSGAFITALSSCGVYARRLSGTEILETLRYHFHPYSAAQIKTEDVIEAHNYKNLFTTSDFPETMKKEMEAEQREIEEKQEEIRRLYEEVGYEIPEDAPDVIYMTDEDYEEGGKADE
ncbi:MAG: hypothetical protein IKH06_00370 [Clostridiales bacterium]|nr:hypothetical protein [Clostridiales bacterium]